GFVAFLLHKVVVKSVFSSPTPQKRALNLFPVFFSLTSGLMLYFIGESILEDYHIDMWIQVLGVLTLCVIIWAVLHFTVRKQWYERYYMRSDEVRSLLIKEQDKVRDPTQEVTETEAEPEVIVSAHETADVADVDVAVETAKDAVVTEVPGETETEEPKKEREVPKKGYFPKHGVDGAEPEWFVRAQAVGPQSDRFKVRGPEVKLVSRYVDYRRSTMDGIDGAAKYFVALTVFTAVCICFGHGANDVANAGGPLAGIYSALQGTLSSEVDQPQWIVVLSGFGIVLGLATYGPRVMKTVGKSITELDPLVSFVCQFSTTLTVLVCSSLQMPISTTHILVGSVSGAGISANGPQSLSWKVLGRIAISWLVTLPVAGVTCVALFLILNQFV
ncbi:phosphate transporter, partial [Kipferlia bialata]